MDLRSDGRLLGVTLLEERSFWRKGVIAWPLPTRATPHRLTLDAPKGAPSAAAEVRWDASRRLCGILFGDVAQPDVLALGPRAYAVVDGDVLVALLADLRGFDRAAG